MARHPGEMEMAAALDTRLDVRMSSQVKNLIQEAATLAGQSIGEFPVSTLTEAAKRIVEQDRMTVLSNRDRDVFLAMLDADDPPNAALRKAAKRFRKNHA